MKSRPILFSAPMVLALLAGQKRQTRRLLNPQPIWCPHSIIPNPKPKTLYVCPDAFPTTARVGLVLALCDRPGSVRHMGSESFAKDFCPYGQPGDELRVSESHRMVGSVSATRLVEVQYDADETTRNVVLTQAEWDKFCSRKTPWAKLSGRYMLRSLSRLTLIITGIRVELVQEITEADAVAEGFRDTVRQGRNRAGDPVESYLVTARDQFAELWETINGAESWAANPWVWVVSFEVKAGAA